MSSLASMVAADGPILLGHHGVDVRILQIALQQAGYPATISDHFTLDTATWVKRFQNQHGLEADGKVGTLTAALLDAPHAVLLDTAVPIVPIIGSFPHDDTKSLLAFYGNPATKGWEEANLVPVVSPWPMTEEGKPVKAIMIHKKCAVSLLGALNDIWKAYDHDLSKIHLDGLQVFDGCFNYRPIRGCSRLSTHAFAAAIDINADKYPMNYKNEHPLPKVVYDAFIAHGAYCGQDFRGRQDPMHIQFAHE